MAKGPDWCAGFVFAFPMLKLIMLSVHDEWSVSQAVIEAGANGFVLKRAVATELLPAVEAVLAGRCLRFAPPTHSLATATIRHAPGVDPARRHR